MSDASDSEMDWVAEYFRLKKRQPTEKEHKSLLSRCIERYKPIKKIIKEKEKEKTKVERVSKINKTKSSIERYKPVKKIIREKMKEKVDVERVPKVNKRKLSIENDDSNLQNKRKKKKEEGKETKSPEYQAFEAISLKKKYHLIVADPPWQYKQTWGAGIAEKQYDLMTTEQIMNLPVWKIADKDCILFLWVTNVHTHTGIKVMEAWKFAFKNFGFVWIKLSKNGDPRMGMGRWIRGVNENCYAGVRGYGSRFFERYNSHAHCDSICFMGVRGKPNHLRENKGMHNYIETSVDESMPEHLDTIYSEIRGHSVKPMGIMIERLKRFFGSNYDSMNKIELFSRKNRPGWDCWGNECGKMDRVGATGTNGHIIWDELPLQTKIYIQIRESVEKRTNYLVEIDDKVGRRKKQRIRKQRIRIEKIRKH